MAGAPFLLLQITDTHIGGDWGGEEDPVAGLQAVVDEVLRLPDRPDAVVHTGDLVEHGAPEEYAVVRELTSALPAPLHVLPGNHDDRAVMRAQFGLAGSSGDPIHYAADLGPLRLIAVDTSIPGHVAGALDAEQLAWLDDTLAAEPTQVTVLALHHPPVATGVAPWDEIGLPPAHRTALADVLERHPQVRRVVCGHVHQAITGTIAGRPALTIPSTYVQGRLDFTATELQLGPGPRGFAVHVVVEGEIVSYVRTID